MWRTLKWGPDMAVFDVAVGPGGEAGGPAQGDGRAPARKALALMRATEVRVRPRGPRAAAPAPRPSGDGDAANISPKVEADDTSRATIARWRGLEAFGKRAEPAAAVELDPDTEQRINARVRRRLFGAPPSPIRIGRFMVLEEIGRGGMGRVYSAYDEQLDRKVAVKVLLDDEFPGEADRLRFRREAQALARLSHPNVVTVHEVGDSDGQFFLAMEYIRGQSLSRWLRTSPSWQQVLEVFVQAGRGLVAAHAAGLVHRDLKPANLMRSDDGVVKVLDFGLARVAADQPEIRTEESRLTSSHSSLSLSLTQSGVVMGTPAYMAPEQFGGEALDTRSDQYSFCMVLWEGLTGVRLFSGANVDELLEARLIGPPPWPDSAPPMPKVIIEAIRRGLAVDPNDRWPSIEALLEVLARTPRRRRNRWPLGLAVVGSLGLGGMIVKTWSEASKPRCSGAERQLDGTWDDARRAEVGAALLSVEQPYASAVWSRVNRELDGYAQAWVTMHNEACEATAVRQDQSPRVLDLRMGCLSRAAGELRATVDTLADADDTVLGLAQELVADLRPLSHCADTDALDAMTDPPRPRDADAVERALQHLARAKSEHRAGRHDSQKEAVEAAADLLDGVDYPPARAELLLRRGELQRNIGNAQASADALSDAVELATRNGQRRLAADAATSWMQVVGTGLERPDAALALRPFIQGLVEAGTPRSATYHGVLGQVLAMQARYGEAEAAHRKALGVRLELLGPDHIDVGASHTDLGGLM